MFNYNSNQPYANDSRHGLFGQHNNNNNHAKYINKQIVLKINGNHKNNSLSELENSQDYEDYDYFQSNVRDDQEKLNSLSEFRADNIYIKGGNNMAEALNWAKNDGGSISIAMRMKKNREINASLNTGYS